jgi:hypothetical protein
MIPSRCDNAAVRSATLTSFPIAFSSLSRRRTVEMVLGTVGTPERAFVVSRRAVVNAF